MARRKSHVPLDVYLNGRLVGQLRKGSSGAIDFQYDPAWLNWANALPVSLSLPLQESRYIGEPVIAVFDNLLPEHPEIRRRLAERTQAGGTDAYSLLATIGRDCVGALQFLPEGADPAQTGPITSRPASNEAIQRRLEELSRVPLGIHPEEGFRISLAGMQEKTALLHYQGQWHFPTGNTATTHIIKPAMGRRGGIDLSQSVENEYLCLRFLSKLDLPTAVPEIIEFGNQRVLVVERFDRRWTQDGRLLRLPQEDGCQALSILPGHKYESHGGPGISQLLRLFRGSDDPASDQKTFLKSCITFWLLGATDGHAKNFSLFLLPGGRYRMTPLYDVMSVQPLVDTHQLNRNEFKLAMSVGNSRRYAIHRIQRRHFFETAEASGIGPSVVTGILDELQQVSEAAITSTLNALPENFPESLATAIFNGYRQRLDQLSS